MQKAGSHVSMLIKMFLEYLHLFWCNCYSSPYTCGQLAKIVSKLTNGRWHKENILQFILDLQFCQNGHFYMNIEYIGLKKLDINTYSSIFWFLCNKTGWSDSLTINPWLQIIDITDPNLLCQCPHFLNPIISDHHCLVHLVTGVNIWANMMKFTSTTWTPHNINHIWAISEQIW